ncbi:Uridine nucleosidase [Lentibacillus sp. JNUCC-1]|uniref:nucleoside hydrolase n=1 Tax=Lentibacillus sp. JNUCC-1 TaxID=2654513 RepID=UPI0012E838BF|nr:nucleoside hydrolase [Lentibacillus sp. JNUCC-1]MUV36766.1 Uridine nucleosidase [Lentibacillus sp. JNUCC-1]
MTKLNNKVILDVDTGVDDALSIIYGVESKQIDLLGITTVSGNVPVEMVIPNTRKVLKLIGCEEISVFPGASRPLLREPEYEYRVHGTDGIGNSLDDVQLEPHQETQFAPDFIIEKAREFQGNLSLIMVGPVTNLALALRKEPKIAEWIDEVIIMGGLISKAGRGNKLPTSEFNIYADPDSARIVFHSGIEITLVSLDVTTQTYMTQENIEQLKGTKYYDFVLNSTKVYREFSEKLYGKNGCALHDPLTIGYFLDRSYLETEKFYVDIETISPLSYGQTICDFRNILKKKPNVNICNAVDGERFVNDFLKVIKNAK